MSAPRLPSVIGVSIHRHTVTSIPLGDGHIVNIIQDAKNATIADDRKGSLRGEDGVAGRRGRETRPSRHASEPAAAPSGDLQKSKAECGQSIRVPHQRTRERRPWDTPPPQEPGENVLQLTASQSMSAERDTGDVLPAHLGEVAANVSRFGAAEDEPGLALVGEAVVGLDAETSRRERFRRTGKQCQFAGGPAGWTNVGLDAADSEAHRQSSRQSLDETRLSTNTPNEQSVHTQTRPATPWSR
jgi:hypothetical protein